MGTKIISFSLGLVGGFIIASNAMDENPKDVFYSLMNKYNIVVKNTSEEKNVVEL